MSDGQLARLTALDVCAVSDALDWADLPGSVPGLRPLSGTRLAGRARTVLTGPADGSGRHIADGSGVVFVPADRAEEVLTVAERIAARQARTLDRVRAGEPVTGLMPDANLTEGL
jgi:regulator of RNase E activity RraA